MMDDLDIGSAVNWNQLLGEDTTNHQKSRSTNANTPTTENPLCYNGGCSDTNQDPSTVSNDLDNNSIDKKNITRSISAAGSDDLSTTASSINLRGPVLQIPSVDGRSCRFKVALSIPGVHALTSPEVPSTPSLLQGSAGIFIGQIPITYSPDDLRNMLVSLAAEKGVPAEIKEIKIHPRNTCAFVLVNRAALKPIVSYSKQVLCDSTFVWVGETAEAGTQLSQLAAQTHAGQAGRTMLGVPKTTMVMEACSRSRRPRMDGGVAVNSESAPSYASVFPNHTNTQPTPQYTPTAPIHKANRSSINVSSSMLPQQQQSQQFIMQQQHQYVQPQQFMLQPPTQQQYTMNTQPQFLQAPLPQQQASMASGGFVPQQSSSSQLVFQYNAQGQQVPCIPMVDPLTGSIVMVPVQVQGFQQQQQAPQTIYF